MSKISNSLRPDFFIKRDYQFAKQNNQKLNFWYGQLCNIFISHYSVLGTPQIENPENKSQLEIISSSGKYEFTKYLKAFMLDFTAIMKEVSNFQIVRLTHLKDDNEPEFEVFEKLLRQIKDNRSTYDQMQVSKSDLSSLFRQIKQTFTNYKINLENPINCYNQKFVVQSNRKILGSIQSIGKLLKVIESKKQSLLEKMPQFESFYQKFKCKLVKNKYTVLKKVHNFIQNTKYCFIQLTEFFKECVENHRAQFLQLYYNKKDDITELKELLNRSSSLIQLEHPLDENKRWETAIKSTLQVYCIENEEVERAVALLSEYFISCHRHHQQKRVKLREIINNICQFYQANQSPFDQLIQLYNVNEKLQKKFHIILERLNQILQTIKKSKKKCLKHGEIILSLLKIKTAKNQGFLEYSENVNKKDIEELVNEITFSHTKEHILSFYQSCIMTQNDLLDAIKISVRPRRKTLDSMEISHSLSTNKFTIEKKKPLREQYWLWKDNKEEQNHSAQLYQQYTKEIIIFVQDLASKFICKNNIELQKYDCALLQDKKQGTLTLMSQNLLISTKKLHLSIRWKDVIGIEASNSFFNKCIVIVTPQGRIELTKFNTEQSNIIASMRQIQDKSNLGSQTSIQRKKEIELTPEEIKGIEERKLKIMKDVPKTDSFKLIIAETFENERIDEIYELLYSDKPFNFYGREEPCFFSYTGKKSGNINWLSEKYDKPGPQFYTLQEGVNFRNCPLFSTRKITYNHIMKPTSIPFMPKQSRNEDERRIYWVSHEQLIYYIKSKAFQVPFADVFQVHLLHRITKIDTSVKIEIFSKVVFLKETSFKSIIFANTDPELDENMLSFMGEIEKLLKLRKEAANGVKIPVQLELPIESKVEPADNQVTKLKFYNKVLIGGLFFLLFLNLLKYF